MFHTRSSRIGGMSIIGRVVAGAGACALLIFGHAPTGWALPPGGAQPDTPGTSSSVSPSTVEQCGTLNFTINGFPAGETVHIKIDNGEGFGGDASIQGQGVIHSQAIDSSGTSSGSFQIPCNLPAGEHFLRYLATEVLYDANGNQQGTKGYTNVGSSVFYVTESAAGGGNASGNDSTNTDTGTNTGTATGTGNTNSGVSNNANQRNNSAAGAARGNTADGSPAGAAAAASGDGAVANQAQGAAGTAGATGGGAGPVQPQAGGSTLQSGAAKASGFGATNNGATAANGGIFDKNAQANGVNLAASSGPNSTPYIGFFVGGAILLVGMTAINAWLYVQRRNNQLQQ